MSWVTVVGSMIASACLTLAGMHLFIWYKQRKAWGNLLFALSAAGTALFAAGELWLMRSGTIAEYGTALRWLHVPAWVIILALTGFVQIYLRAGRPWLAWTVAGARTLSLVLNFILTPNLNYREITYLRQRIGIPLRIRDLGGTEDQLPRFAEKAFTLKRLRDVNPRRATQQDLLGILQAAF